MAMEQSSFTNQITIEHLFSPVTECIALLSSLIQSDHHEFATLDHSRILNELSEESITFIYSWKASSKWDMSQLFGLFIPAPIFHDISLFIASINKLSNQEYIYHFLGEALTLHSISDGLHEPHQIIQFKEKAPWILEDETWIITFFSDINSIREAINNVLIDIWNSKIFQILLDEHKTLIHSKIEEIKSIDLEPLPLAQYIMGKTIRRISNYEKYLFIPSYYVTPHRIRIFDQSMCIVIYGSAEPLRDIQGEAQVLDKRLKALSDLSRLMILRMLHSQKLYGAKLAENLNLTTATVSHHLDALKQADFIAEERIGNIKYFSVNTIKLNEFIHDLKRFIIE